MKIELFHNEMACFNMKNHTKILNMRRKIGGIFRFLDSRAIIDNHRQTGEFCEIINEQQKKLLALVFVAVVKWPREVLRCDY